MSIAFDVSTELAKRIADEASRSDLVTVVVYWLSTNDEGNTFYPLLKAWRYQSSPPNKLYAVNGYLDRFHAELPVNSCDALASLLYPPGCCQADSEILYLVLSGDQPVPEKFEFTKCLDKLIPEVFSSCVLFEFVSTDRVEIGGIECFLKHQLADFIWNILS